MDIGGALKAKGYGIEYKPCSSIYQNKPNITTLPESIKYTEATVLNLLATRLESLEKNVGKIIAEEARKHIVSISVRQRINEQTFDVEYRDIWENLIGFKLNSEINQSSNQIVLVTTDSLDWLNNIGRVLQPSTKVIYIAHRIKNALNIITIIRKDGQLVNVNYQAEEQNKEDRLIRVLRKLQRPAVPPINAEHSTNEDIFIEANSKLFESGHWNRAYSGININRDNITYQYYDFLGNRTLHGFNGTKGLRNEYLLTGGSAAWCREHPYRSGLAFTLEKKLRAPVTNIAGCGENIEHELAKINHYLMYKGIPKAIISFTGFNDIATAPSAQSPKIAKLYGKIGHYSQSSKDWKYWDMNSFIQKVTFVLRQLNSLAVTYNYKQWVFLQPDCLDDKNQYSALINSELNPGIEAEIDRIRNIDVNGREQRKRILKEFIQRSEYSNIQFVDLSTLFANECSTMFYDWVHLTRSGVEKVATAIHQEINHD